MKRTKLDEKKRKEITETTKTLNNENTSDNEYKKQKNIMKNKFNFKSIILTLTLLTLGVGQVGAI